MLLRCRNKSVQKTCYLVGYFKYTLCPNESFVNRGVGRQWTNLLIKLLHISKKKKHSSAVSLMQFNDRCKPLFPQLVQPSPSVIHDDLNSGQQILCIQQLHYISFRILNRAFFSKRLPHAGIVSILPIVDVRRHHIYSSTVSGLSRVYFAAIPSGKRMPHHILLCQGWGIQLLALPAGGKQRSMLELF